MISRVLESAYEFRRPIMKLWVEGRWSLKTYLSRSAWSFAIFFSNFLIFHPTASCWSRTVSLTFFLNMSTLCLRREKCAAFFWPLAWNLSRLFRYDEWEIQATFNRINKPRCTRQVRFAWHLVSGHSRRREGWLWEDLRPMRIIFHVWYWNNSTHYWFLSWLDWRSSAIWSWGSYIPTNLSINFYIDYGNTKPTHIMKGPPFGCKLDRMTGLIQHEFSIVNPRHLILDICKASLDRHDHVSHFLDVIVEAVPGGRRLQVFCGCGLKLVEVNLAQATVGCNLGKKSSSHSIHKRIARIAGNSHLSKSKHWAIPVGSRLGTEWGGFGVVGTRRVLSQCIESGFGDVYPTRLPWGCMVDFSQSDSNWNIVLPFTITVQKTTWMTSNLCCLFLAITPPISIFPVNSKRYAAAKKNMSSDFRCKMGLGFTNMPSEFW